MFLKNLSQLLKQSKYLNVIFVSFFFLLLGILAELFLFLSGQNSYISSPENLNTINANVQTLTALENRAPLTIQKNVPGEITDMAAEQDKVLNITAGNYSIDQLRSWFQNAVILGDSMTSAAAEYGFLGTDVVLGQIGAAVVDSANQFDAAAKRHPSVAFLFFGENDLSNYLSNYSMYIQDYATRINELKASNPDIVCYVEAILPMQPNGLRSTPGSEYIEQYNTALKQYCEATENVYFIDSAFLLQKEAELYEPDGIHPVKEFYPKWLTYLADIAGLSAEQS